jgi:hypothetical protein
MLGPLQKFLAFLLLFVCVCVCVCICVWVCNNIILLLIVAATPPKPLQATSTYRQCSMQLEYIIRIPANADEHLSTKAV